MGLLGFHYPWLLINQQQEGLGKGKGLGLRGLPVYGVGSRAVPPSGHQSWANGFRIVGTWEVLLYPGV